MTSHSPIFGPTALRLKPVMTVTEQLGFWLKGHLVKDPAIKVELSFEQYGSLPPFPNSWFTYLRLSTSIQTLFEFQLGKLVVSEPIAAEYVYDLVNVTAGHTPVPVTDRPTEETIRLKREERVSRVALMPRLPRT